MRLLGVVIDPKLSMCECVRECVHEASWRLKSVVRTRRYHTDGELIQHFKAHVLSYVEYRTPGLYHAASTILEPLNRILRSFLRDVNVGLEDALLHFNLAHCDARFHTPCVVAAGSCPIPAVVCSRYISQSPTTAFAEFLSSC